VFGDTCVYYYQVRSAMALGRPRTPALTIAVTLWTVEYHHLPSLLAVTGSKSFSLLL
jgi:hypothetical protein